MLAGGRYCKRSVHSRATGCRMYLYGHVIVFSCEVTILMVTLVKLFSDFRQPDAETSAADRRCGA